MLHSRSQHSFSRRALTVSLTTVSILAAALGSPPAAASSGTAASAGRFSATYIDPYRVFDASASRLDAMFQAQHRVGITTAIVQWTGYIADIGTVTTTYPASSGTHFGSFDTVLPRLLASAKRNHVTVWLGLAVRPNIFDDTVTDANTTVFTHDAAVDLTLANDLLQRYRGQFAGWYLPSEPGYHSITSTTTQQAQTTFLKRITTGLHQLPTHLPTMISPSVPRAIEGGLTGTEFVQRLTPMIRGAGIDVWNFQDGYTMTGWSPQANLTLLQTGKRITAAFGAAAWATLYTPGPGDPGSMTATSLFTDLDTIRAANIPITTWTFDSALNPDPTRTDTASRIALYQQYATHISN